MSDPITDLKRELLAAAERQQVQTVVPAGPTRWVRRLGRNRLLLAAAALSIVAAVSLLFTAPWSNSPGFLERAHAALTPPPGTILHQKWKVTSTSTDPACTVTRGPNEIWIDRTPPHRYRVLLNDLPLDLANADPLALAHTLACSNGTASELGGGFDAGETLRFVPPKTLTLTSLSPHFPLDPAGDLREAISAGRAHDEGKTELDGRIVQRIRIDRRSCPHGCASANEPHDWYVDPETFHPVETRGLLVFPLGGGPVVRLNIVTRYMTFEHLPRTPANLALTDIRAQHPDASPAEPTG